MNKKTGRSAKRIEFRTSTRLPARYLCLLLLAVMLVVPAVSADTTTLPAGWTNNLKFWYKFDEPTWTGAAGEVKDVLGISNGTLNVTYANVTSNGKFGNGGDWTGTTKGRLDIPPNSQNNFLSYEINSIHPLSDAHQGVSFDGTYYYIYDTTKIFKYDTSWNLITSNVNAATNVNGDHLGDGDYYDGKLYLPTENYTSCANTNSSTISIFNATDLSYIEQHSVATEGKEYGSLTINATDNMIYLVSYCDNSKIFKYFLNNFTYAGTIALSSTYNNHQGITEIGNQFYVISSVNDPNVYVYSKTGTVTNLFKMNTYCNEGLDTYNGFLYCNNGDGTNYNITPSVLTVAIDFWMNSTALPSEMSGSYARIFRIEEDNFAVFYRKAPAQLEWKIYTYDIATPRNIIAEAGNLTKNGWMHVLLQYNGTTQQAYINGVLKDTQTRAKTSYGGINFFWELNFDGELPAVFDNVRLWNRTFASGDMTDLMAAGYTTANLPVASFSTNVTSGTVPLAVQFTDSSSNTPTGWNWSFGDGNWNNGTNSSVSHLYVSTGSFNAFLIASNAAGSDQSDITTITATSTVTANWTVSTNNTCTLYDVQFTDASIGATNWSWNLGAGLTSTDRNPLVAYGIPGIFNVSLQATNESDSSWDNRTDYMVINDCTPVAHFSANTTTVTTNGTVAFTDTSTPDTTSWKWTFRNATSTWAQFSINQNPTKTFTIPGVYSINLTATNPTGSDDELKIDYITVSDAPVPNATPTSSNGLSPHMNDSSVAGALGVIGVISLILVAVMIVGTLAAMSKGTMGKEATYILIGEIVTFIVVSVLLILTPGLLSSITSGFGI